MSSERPPTVQVTARDRELFAFMAEHRLVRADQLARAMGTTAGAAQARLRALREAKLVRTALALHGQPDAHQITRRGLGVIDSPLPAPRLDLRGYAHDIGVAWLWLAARDGAFGALSELIGERALRSRDGPGRRSDPPLAVRLGGTGPRGGDRLHYPDLVLVTAGGRRIAVELELTAKSRTRREQILSAYAADPRIDAVLYLVRSRAIGDPVIETARRLGASGLVHVQKVALKVPLAGREEGAVAERRRAANPDRGRER